MTKTKTLLEIAPMGPSWFVLRIDGDTVQRLSPPLTKRAAFKRAREIAETTGERVRKSGEQ